MKHIFTGLNLVGAVSLLTLAVGCANPQQTEKLLSAAGFTTVIANTPQQREQLKKLTPNKVTLVQRNGENSYVYADPAHYQIYVGDSSEYQKYQQLRQANSLAQDQFETNQLSWQTLTGFVP
ncbi:MAG: hypothetical protein WB586_17705 [Chthoniobacterales bacterium]